MFIVKDRHRQTITWSNFFPLFKPLLSVPLVLLGTIFTLFGFLQGMLIEGPPGPEGPAVSNGMSFSCFSSKRQFTYQILY